MGKKDITRTKLFKMVQSFDEHDAKFRPTIADCREAFRNINRNVFNNELKMPSFRLVYTKAFWGECQGVLGDQTKVKMKINKSFLSKRLFINTMAHEMVHLILYLQGKRYELHNKNFYNLTYQIAAIYGWEPKDL
jgi:hypothetical protein